MTLVADHMARDSIRDLMRVALDDRTPCGV
jgi:hypothetical protein